jgi:hypothetical protein
MNPMFGNNFMTNSASAFWQEPTSSKKDSWKNELERTPEAVEIDSFQFNVIHGRNMENMRFKVTP